MSVIFIISTLVVVEIRKLIRLRGSYLLYLPKKVASGYVSDEVLVFWEGDFIGVRPVASRRAEVDAGLGAAVVAGYAAGLDELTLPAAPDVVKAVEKIGAAVSEVDGRYVVKYRDRYLRKEEGHREDAHRAVFLLEGLPGGWRCAPP
jgi:hypothetical protein